MMLVDLIFDPSDEIEVSEREASAGQNTVKMARQIFNALRKSGYNATINEVTANDFRDVIGNLKGDIIFNQVEEDDLGFRVLKFIEKLGKPVTGVGSDGYKISWEKDRVKSMLVSAGVSTPRYFVANSDEKIDIKDFSFPLFVKAADDHGSLSITGNSYVRNLDELTRQIKWIKGTIGGDALVEEYIQGRELGVTVLGNGKSRRVLPIKETIFGKGYNGRPKIFTYEAKWKKGSKDYLGTEEHRCPAILTKEERRIVEEEVLDASFSLEVRDYARFDVILRDKPYIIDYNSNPGIGEDDDTALSARVYGMTYPQFISEIVEVALRRY